jgi:hypothetical protein
LRISWVICCAVRVAKKSTRIVHNAVNGGQSQRRPKWEGTR